jgi:hypothetical protein
MTAFTPCSPPTDWVKFPASSAPWGAELDLELWARPCGEIAAVFSYNAQLFDPQCASELASGFTRVLTALAGTPVEDITDLRARLPATPQP